MKVFVVLAALVAVACAEASLQAIFQAKWNNFKAAHGKNYNRDEEPKRLQAYLENSREIALHNERFARGEASFELSHNQFSDMPHEEFVEKMLGFNQPESVESSGNSTVFQLQSNLQAPSSVDWRWYTGTVKNQGQCGSCYSFSALGALEGALARKANRNFDLSEQEVVDCSQRQGNYGCNGGFMTAVFNYVKANGGVNYEGDYTYTGQLGSCRHDSRKAKQTLNSHVVVPQSEQALSQALATVGPVAIALDASPRTFMLYSKGIFEASNCNPNKLSHAVLATGFGSENGKEYYMVKNSWGTGWGEAGYFKIVKGQNMCGITNMASYPLL